MSLYVLRATDTILLLLSAKQAHSGPFSDAKIQAPELTAPSRGSVAGAHSSFTMGSADVSRGAFSLQMPAALPTDRGEVPVTIFPTYSPDHGISEWGLGWSVSTLSIMRSRIVGSLDYATDDRTGPWGPMVRGSDGAWITDGFNSRVRIVETGNELIAYQPDGSRWLFGGDSVVNTDVGTYAWNLHTIISPIGHVTRFQYERNSSGRLFLCELTYGDSGSHPQYKVQLTYSSYAPVLEDYTSGKNLSLDRRIDRVKVLAYNETTQHFSERWSYQINHLQDKGSSVFYLVKIQQIFASGQVAPPVTYTYHHPQEHFARVEEQHVRKLDAVLNPAGKDYYPDVIRGNKSTIVDIDEDGLPDLESNLDYSILHQTQNGFIREALPENPNANPYCRPAMNSERDPRILARMRPEDREPSVVSTTALGVASSILICTRSGDLRYEATIPGNWEVGRDVKLVDINRDNQPDLVRIMPGSYEILPNVSTTEHYRFGDTITGRLEPWASMDGLWIHDFNGDGIPDLIGRVSGASGTLIIWYGVGRYRFNPQRVQVQLMLGGLGPIMHLSRYQLTFFDSNNDGMTDILVSDSHSTMLFVNRGADFWRIPVPAFDRWNGSSPTVLDASGGGNTEVVVVRDRRAYAIDLTFPGLGLLHTVDDGKGTHLEYSYKRAAPEVGVRYRNSLFSQVTVTSTGYDSVIYEYDYRNPVLHSRGRFLLGYEKVVRRGSLSTDETTYLHGDHHPGLVLSVTKGDFPHPAAEQVSYRRYEDSWYQGVSWKRLKAEGKGWKSTDATNPSYAIDETEYLAYENNEYCPSEVMQTNAHGVVVTSTEYDQVAGLREHLMCLHARVTMSSVEGPYPFTHAALYTHNPRGQLERMALLGPTGPLMEQEVEYTPAVWCAVSLTQGRGRPFSHSRRLRGFCNESKHRKVSFKKWWHVTPSRMVYLGLERVTALTWCIRSTFGLMAKNVLSKPGTT